VSAKKTLCAPNNLYTTLEVLKCFRHGVRHVVRRQQQTCCRVVNRHYGLLNVNHQDTVLTNYLPV